ncbi:MAG: hypothetical protein ACK55R_08420 [Cyanobacteriota bacterium]
MGSVVWGRLILFMPLNIDALSRWGPYGFIDSELGRIAIFALSTGADEDLEVATRRLDDPVCFARHLARYACFPSDNLRDGKYRPKEPIFGMEEISTLSDTSLAKMARFFIKVFSGDDADLLDVNQALHLLMTQFRDDWKKRSEMFQDTLSPFRGLSDGFMAIDSQIKTLNWGLTGGLGGFSQKPSGSLPEDSTANIIPDAAMPGIARLHSSRLRMLADAAANLEEIREGIRDTASALQQVATIQEAMNTQASQQVEAEQQQRIITRRQNRLVVCLTCITLAATVFIGPVSRLSCAASRATRMLAPFPGLVLGAKIVCGY